MRIARDTHKMLLLALATSACAAPWAGAAAWSSAALASTGGATGGLAVPEGSMPEGSTPEGSTAEGSTPAASVRASGIATWFGPGFYGKRTACGQTLTRGVLGVANRTLPCGTLVEVTYKGASVTLPVLDRGPYGHHASWDLTAGAAHALGITETVRVATHVVGRTANTPTLGLPPGSEDAAAAGGALAG
jgi:rare lipoprotein A (peptidoglycan hydrolase)